MKIRIVHQYFHPDISSVSQVISQIAFHLARSGDEVSVICSRNRYDGGRTGSLPVRETVEGVLVERCWGPSLGRKSLFSRILDILSFCLLASIRALSSPRVDSVILLTNPPMFSLLGTIVKRLRRERFVYVVMDLYPDIAVRAGVLRAGSVAERVARKISRRTLKDADRVVVLGEDMKDAVVREGALPEKVTVIRNWGNPDTVYPVEPGQNPLKRTLGLEEKFVVEYSGNFGVSHFFEDILHTAGALEGHDNIRFLFLGGGVRRKEIEDYVASGKAKNVMILPYQESSDLARSLSVGDVHYISLRAGFEGLVVPSKAYGIMAAGRPVIYQGNPEGEIARMVEREKIGVVISPGDLQGLKDAILALYRDREARIRMGATARRVLIEKYSDREGLALYRKAIAGTP